MGTIYLYISFSLFFLVLSDCYGNGISTLTNTSRIPLESCKPLPGMSKQQCEKMVSAGCQELLAWVGVGCTDSHGKRYKDGGCQTLSDGGVYCNWKCRSRCIASDSCIWTGNECRVRGCGTFDVYDLTPPDSIVDAASYIGVKPTSWSDDGLILPITMSRNALCGLLLYALSPRAPDEEELKGLEITVTKNTPSDWLNNNMNPVTLVLARAVTHGRFANTALTWHSLRYEMVNQTLVVPDTNNAYLTLRFPKWKSYPFSLLSRSDDLPYENRGGYLSCLSSFSNASRKIVNTCQTTSERRSLLLKVFA